MKTLNIKFSFLLLFFLVFTSLSALELSNDTFDSSTDGYTGAGVSATSGWLVITRDNTASKTYNFGASYANQTVTFNISYRTSGGWENSGSSQDYFKISVNGTQEQSYSVVNGTYTESFTANTDATGKVLLALNPDTTGDSEQVELDYVQITSSILNAEYRFDECSYKGNVNEVTDSVGTSNGQSYNGVLIDSSDSTICSSASFDGTDDYISMGDTFNDIFGSTSNSFTITGWIKPTSFSTITSNHGTANSIFAKASDSNNDNLEIGVNSTGNLHIYLDTDADYSIDIGTGITLNSWHFISVSYDGSTLTAVIDGTVYTNATPNGNFDDANGSPFSIGTTLNRDTSFTGLIDEVKIFSVALNTTAINTIFANEKAGNEYLGTSRTCDACLPGFCEKNSLTEGFHIVDPTDDGNTTNSFEIYCDRSDASDIKDVLKLPISIGMSTAEYSNFTFNASISTDKNYYNSSHAKTAINYIRINANTMEVMPDNSTGFFNGEFSSLNLRGTPFTFDWDNLDDNDIGGCQLSKMRLDYDSTNKSGGQTLKINPKQEDVYKCSSNSLKLKLLDEYKYITYLGSEVLEKSCKVMSANLPDAGEYENISGYYYIDPKNGGRSSNQNLSDYRPFVTYCMEVTGTNPEDQYSWTMFLNLDGTRTNHHDNIKDGIDTCTNLGLIFFVPNTQGTFNKVKNFLFSQKGQWKDYTGKMDEYFTDRDISGWGASHQTTRDYWPYGPMGLYYDDGPSSDWDPTITNGQTINGKWYGYDLTSTSAIGGVSINIAHLNNTKNNGWKTTLSDLNISEDFWITDMAAGKFENSAPGCTVFDGDKCYNNDDAIPEPNGDYDQGNWMHFWADDNGDIYHYNDQNGARKYIHDHYMCIAEDNYEIFSRFGLTEGPFTVIEGGQTITDGASISSLDLNITTKIVKEPLDFDIVTFDTAVTVINKDQNISAGLFLSTIVTDPTLGESSSDLHYFGQIGTISPDFNTSSGSAYIANSTWPSGTNKITSANKRLFFQFKYCSQDNLEWDDCWTHVGNEAICTDGCIPNDLNCICKTSESNDFAMRPKNFALASINGVISGGKLVVRAEDANISYLANDYEDGATVDYNTSFTELDTDVTLINLGLSCSTSYLSDTNQSTYYFTDGQDSHTYTLSDVGEYSFRIQEIDGQEFALVDKNDTADTDRFITPNAINLLIKPHHFNIAIPPTNINHNSTTGFTYLSNDLTNMAVTLNFRATAQNHLNTTTLNYSKDCYASNVNIDFEYSIPSGDLTLPNPVGKIIYKDFITTGAIDINSTASLLKGGLLIPPTQVFTTDHNGSADFQIKFNFQRDINATKNPFVVNVNDLNVSDLTTALLIGTDASHTLDVNATMFYGRANGPTRAITKICHTTGPCLTNDTPDRNNPTIVYQAYSDNPALLPTFTNNGTGDTRWFANSWHREINNDGLIGIISEDAGNVDHIAGSRSGGVFSFEYYLRYHGLTFPYISDMKNTPSPWLIYNENNSSAAFNEFQVEFSSAGAWSGKAENNTTTATKAKGVTNRRTMW